MRTHRRHCRIADKIKTRNQLKKITTALQKAGSKVVFSNGCFDLLHYGHAQYLEDARALGDCLVVAVNSDASVRSIKGPGRPVVTQTDRARVIAALESVDFVTVFNQATPLALIKYLQPDVLVKGADWDPESIVGAKEVRSTGGKVRSLALAKGRSTTSLIKKIVNAYHR